MNIKELLCKCKELLEKTGETYWSNKMDFLLKENIDDELMKNIIVTWFGGMGSLNDLYICKENGYLISENDEILVNEKLEKLRVDIYNFTICG